MKVEHLRSPYRTLWTKYATARSDFSLTFCSCRGAALHLSIEYHQAGLHTPLQLPALHRASWRSQVNSSAFFISLTFTVHETKAWVQHRSGAQLCCFLMKFLLEQTPSLRNSTTSEHGATEGHRRQNEGLLCAKDTISCQNLTPPNSWSNSEHVWAACPDTKEWIRTLGKNDRQEAVLRTWFVCFACPSPRWRWKILQAGCSSAFLATFCTARRGVCCRFGALGMQ